MLIATGQAAAALRYIRAQRALIAATSELTMHQLVEQIGGRKAVELIYSDVQQH